MKISTDMPGICDTHAHVYSPDEARYPMIAEPLRPPGGAGTLEHLRREMAAAGVERAVAVQVSTAYEWDNRLVADVARANAPWLVSVCTLDPLNPDSPAILRRLVLEDNIRGLRSLPAGGADGQLDHPGVERLWTAAESMGITVQVLIAASQAGELERLLQRHPRLPVVLDHCLEVSVADGPDGAALRWVLYLARYANVHAKLTWLATGSAGEFPFNDTRPLLRAVLDAYGPGRCVWGSNFPCELWSPRAGYAAQLDLFTRTLGLSSSDLHAILVDTPARLWFGAPCPRIP